MPRSRSIHLIRLGFVLLTTVVGLSLAAGEYWWVGALGGRVLVSDPLGNREKGRSA